MTGALNYWVRSTCDLENYVVAAERIKEYSECPQEVTALLITCIRHLFFLLQLVTSKKKILRAIVTHNKIVTQVTKMSEKRQDNA